MKRVAFLLLMAPFAVGAIVAALVMEIMEGVMEGLMTTLNTLDRWSQ